MNPKVSMGRDGALILLGSLEVGGSEAKTVALANALVRRGRPLQLAYLNGPDPLRSRLDPAVDVAFLNRRGKFSLPAVRRLRAQIQTGGIGTILAMNLYPSLYAVGASFFTGTRRPRCLVAVNTTDHVGFREQAEMVVYKKVLRRADKVVFGCQVQLAMWTERYDLGQQRCMVLYNGVDESRFRPGVCAAASEAFRVRLGIGPENVVVGTVGQLRTEKSQHQLIDAIASLQEELPELRGVIVGEGRLRADLEGRIAQLGLGGRVTLVGALDDVRPALGAMDVFVLCSTAVETFSNAALEAMSMGVPVVLSDIGGAREMISDGVEGRIYPRGDAARLADAIRILATDGPRRRAMGAAARRTAETRFGVDRMVTQYETLLWGPT